MGAKLKRRFKVLTVLVILAAVAYVARHQLLQVAGDVLVRNDVGAAPTTYAIVLMGDPTGTRADTALAVYRDHRAQKVVAAMPRRMGWVKRGIIDNEPEVIARYFAAQGVPAGDFIILDQCDAVSTYDEAVCMRDYLQKIGNVDRMLVVTSWYHSSRAGWLFGRVLAPVQVDVVPAISPDNQPQEYWKHRDLTLEVVEEYMKWAYWRLGFSNWET
jgi:uncharacterized SAM-binding protein YcdF (DUF218 family)